MLNQKIWFNISESDKTDIESDTKSDITYFECVLDADSDLTGIDSGTESYIVKTKTQPTARLNRVWG